MRATTPTEPEMAVAAVPKLLSSSGLVSGFRVVKFSEQGSGVGSSRKALLLALEFWNLQLVQFILPEGPPRQFLCLILRVVGQVVFFSWKQSLSEVFTGS